MGASRRSPRIASTCQAYVKDNESQLNKLVDRQRMGNDDRHGCGRHWRYCECDAKYIVVPWMSSGRSSSRAPFF